MSDNTETAILAGGCFWGVQELLRQRDGVISTRVGYTGGGERPPDRREPSAVTPRRSRSSSTRSGSPTGIYSSSSSRSTATRIAGDDIGSIYRSEIFYTSDEQREVAEETIADVDASGLWPGKIVTKISEAGPFWEDQAEDQDHFLRYPDYPDGSKPPFPRVGAAIREPAAQLR